jgi:hypothetical protein
VVDRRPGSSQVQLETAKYESPHLFTGNDCESKPLLHSAILRWAASTTNQLLAKDAKHPLDIVDVPTDQLHMFSGQGGQLPGGPQHATVFFLPARVVWDYFGTPTRARSTAPATLKHETRVPTASVSFGRGGRRAGRAFASDRTPQVDPPPGLGRESADTRARVPRGRRLRLWHACGVLGDRRGHTEPARRGRPAPRAMAPDHRRPSLPAATACRQTTTSQTVRSHTA